LDELRPPEDFCLFWAAWPPPPRDLAEEERSGLLRELPEALLEERWLLADDPPRRSRDFCLVFEAPLPALDEDAVALRPPDDLGLDLEAWDCDFLPDWVAIRSSVVGN